MQVTRDLYVNELFLNSKKNELTKLLQIVEKLDLESKTIRKLKKEINNSISNIEEDFKKSLKINDSYFQGNESIEENISRRQFYLKELLSTLSKIINLACSLKDNNISLDEIVNYLEKTKIIYNEELQNIPNILDRYSKDDVIKIEDEVLYYFCGKNEDFEILSDVKEINSFAFYMNPYIKRVIIKSEHIKHINPMTFAFCPNLEEIILGDKVEVLDHMAIYACPKLNYFEIPEKIISVENDSISYCHGLTSLYKTEGLYSILDNTLLKDDEIILSASLAKLPEVDILNTFSIVNNPNLSIQIPNSVKILKSGAIISSSIYELIIPESVKKIEKLSIIDCQNLTRIVIQNSSIRISDSPFVFCNNLKEIICPIELKDEENKLRESNPLAQIIYY